jgi:hypothetical protein
VNTSAILKVARELVLLISPVGGSSANIASPRPEHYPNACHNTFFAFLSCRAWGFVAMDPFASLGIKSSSKQGSGQSLQERQQQQLAERARLAREQQQANDADAAFWDSFGKARPSGGTERIQVICYVHLAAVPFSLRAHDLTNTATPSSR